MKSFFNRFTKHRTTSRNVNARDFAIAEHVETQRETTQEDATCLPFKELPQDIQLAIIQLLGVRDFLKLKGVCQSLQSFVKTNSSSLRRLSRDHRITIHFQEGRQIEFGVPQAPHSYEYMIDAPQTVILAQILNRPVEVESDSVGEPTVTEDVEPHVQRIKPGEISTIVSKCIQFANTDRVSIKNMTMADWSTIEETVGHLLGGRLMIKRLCVHDRTDFTRDDIKKQTLRFDCLERIIREFGVDELEFYPASKRIKGDFGKAFSQLRTLKISGQFVITDFSDAHLIQLQRTRLLHISDVETEITLHGLNTALKQWHSGSRDILQLGMRFNQHRRSLNDFAQHLLSGLPSQRKDSVSWIVRNGTKDELVVITLIELENDNDNENEEEFEVNITSSKHRLFNVFNSTCVPFLENWSSSSSDESNHRPIHPFRRASVRYSRRVRNGSLPSPSVRYEDSQWLENL